MKCREYVRFMTRQGDVCKMIHSHEEHMKMIREHTNVGIGVGSYERVCGYEFLDWIKLYRPFISLKIEREE